MVITRLVGGLGNQLFQYAVARNISAKRDAILKFDISWYTGRWASDTSRRYALEPFSVTGDIASTEEIRILKKQGITGILETVKPYRWKRYVKERHFHFDPGVLSVSNNVYLDGYWQSEKYFKDSEDIIRREVVLKEPIDSRYSNLLATMRRTDSISIHVRRGDYVSNDKINRVHGVCTTSYYMQAVKILAGKIRNPVFFIFSDDIPWVKKNIPTLDLPVTYVSGGIGLKDYEELMLMSACKHNIIANSSFSWWGAWLNQDARKIVVAPQRWFADPSYNTKDLLPDDWQKISVK